MTEPIQKINRSATLTGIISVLLLLFLITSSSSFFIQLLHIHAINGTLLFISRILFWMCAVVLWLYAYKVEKQSLLLWQEKKYSFLFYLLSFIAIFFTLITGLFCIQRILFLAGLVKKSAELPAIMGIFRTNIPLLVFTSLTAGVNEELIFRGYLLPRLAIIFKSPWLAIIVSSLLFGLLHFKYGTVINVAGPVFIGAVFAFHYWKFRNIKVIIAFHFLWDLCLLLIQVSHK